MKPVSATQPWQPEADDLPIHQRLLRANFHQRTDKDGCTISILAISRLPTYGFVGVQLVDIHHYRYVKALLPNMLLAIEYLPTSPNAFAYLVLPFLMGCLLNPKPLQDVDRRLPNIQHHNFIEYVASQHHKQRPGLFLQEQP